MTTVVIRNPADRPHRTDAGDELVFYVLGLIIAAIADAGTPKAISIQNDLIEYLTRVENEAFAQR